MSKKFLIAVASFFMLLLFSNISVMTIASASFEVEEKTNEFYVNDFADIIPDDIQDEMQKRAEEFHDKTNGVQIVVTTIKSLKGYSIEEYAHSMYNQYKIGKDSMGLLLLFAEEDRDVRIEVGYKMEGYITDSLAGQILDKYGMNYFKKNKFPEGLNNVQINMIDQVDKKLTAEAIKNDNGKQEEGIVNRGPVGNSTDEGIKESSGVPKVFGFIFLAILFELLLMFVVARIVFLKCKEKNIEKLDEAKKKADRLIEGYELQISTKDTEISEAQGIIRDQKSTISQKDGEIKNYRGTISQYEETFNRIRKLHSQIDEELAQMIESENKAKAEEFDKKYEQSLEKDAVCNNIEYFSSIISAYEMLPSNVSKYVALDMHLVRQKYDDSIKDKEKIQALDVKKSIEAIFGKFQVGDHSNFSEIEPVYKRYSRLSLYQKSLLESVMPKLEQMYKSASSDNTIYTKAKKVESSMESTISRCSSASRHDIDTLKKVISEYNNLGNEYKKYILPDLIERLKSLLSTAEAAKRRYESKQAASRRSPTYRSNSSSPRINTGYNGRSHGGGTSRKF